MTVSEISIQNFKSVERLTIPLGRVTVLIGENGSGKSNILESIAFLGAAAADKLDHEFLASRGVRVTNDEKLMCSAFPEMSKNLEPDSPDVVRLSAKGFDGKEFRCRLLPSFGENEELTGWFSTPTLPPDSEIEAFREIMPPDVRKELNRVIERAISQHPEAKKSWGKRSLLSKRLKAESPAEFFREHGADIALRLHHMRKGARQNAKVSERLSLARFLVYSPNYDSLRRFEEEGQIKPLGIKGEGLFKLLQSFNSGKHASRLKNLKKSLELIGWYSDFRIPRLAPGEYRVQMFDRYLGKGMPLDQRSANEGFLFLLFYFALFLGFTTPPFFAIDNIDYSLNPKLCAGLMKRLCELAKQYDKQVICTTHNPAILDGLNLNDHDQRLYVVRRDSDGRTIVDRVHAPKPQASEPPIKLSDAFLSGLIGGLPEHF